MRALPKTFRGRQQAPNGRRRAAATPAVAAAPVHPA
jgi:hypothetical protein